MSGALVKLLHECIGSSVLTGKYCMLVMKCIWKVADFFLERKVNVMCQVIRGLPSWLDAGMDVSLLLADLHSFLVSYPGSYWKQQVPSQLLSSSFTIHPFMQADDTPMRMVKTVIHTLVKQQGEAILGCLNRIQDPQASELVPYIRLGQSWINSLQHSSRLFSKFTKFLPPGNY